MKRLTYEELDALLDGVAADVRDAALAAQDRLAQLIADGVAPKDALREVLTGFNGQYTAQLTEAFSRVLGASVTQADVLGRLVSGVPLSSRLYVQTAQLTTEVAALVHRHASGVHDARALALALYDGYNSQDGIKRPLEGRARATLPKDLRELLATDVRFAHGLEQQIGRMQEAAARLKTQALRAAYTEALDAWLAGASEDALARRLRVAFAEKTRYFANRIAQTELAQAHTDRVADELMANPDITVVQVRLSPGHAKVDICDLHARANLFGLGEGCYPKALAPKPVFHPFCRCRLRSMPSKSADGAVLRPGADVAWLRRLPAWEGAQVVGSKDKLRAVLGGAPMAQVRRVAIAVNKSVAFSVKK